MAFEGLRDSLRDRWSDLKAKIQESSAYNNLREQFAAQSPLVQKLVAFGGVALAALFILSFPLGYLSDAGEHMTAFEENRGLIQGLLRASRTAKEASPLPAPLDPGTFQQLLEGLLHDKKLVPEQIGEIRPIPGEATKLAPAGVVQTGLVAQVKQLNLTQIVELANAFQNLGPGTKVIGLDITPTAGQTHYYDMVARVINFGLPVVAGLVDNGRPGKGKRPAARPSKLPAGEGDDE